MEKWYSILIDLVQRSPQILVNVNGIVRLYDNAEVFFQSLDSHKAEEVFIREYTPGELVEHYPAYQEGVKRGFIAGGAIEIYGLAFAVGTFCRAILNELEKNGTQIHFKKEVQKILLNKNKQIEGILLSGEQTPRTACHYAFHTGAFAGP
jgi:glycine/D-amino acid oxidase-like deaminating enzyme